MFRIVLSLRDLSEGTKIRSRVRHYLGRSDDWRSSPWAINAPTLPSSHFKSIHIMEFVMRSQLIFDAAVNVANRYQLVNLIARAARALHRPGTRIQDTMNSVLVWCSETNCASDVRTNDGPVAVARRRKKRKANSLTETAPDLNRIPEGQSAETSKEALVALTEPFSSGEPSADPLLTIAESMLPNRSTWRLQ